MTTYYNRDGSVRAINKEFSIAGRGDFEVHDENQTLVLLNPKPHAAHELSEEEYRKEPLFWREDAILGFKVFVEHDDRQGQGKEYTDVYYAPALGGIPVKIMDVGAAGYTSIEPTRIELGEPSESEFVIPDYPFDYTFYEQQIKITEERGNSDLASQRRQALEEHKRLFARSREQR